VANRRDEIRMTDDELTSYVAAGRTLTLVTNGPDGIPDPVPMWYVVDDGVVLMRTYARSQKVVNLRRDDRCAALVEDGERYAELRGVQWTGRVRLFDDVERILDVVAGLAIKYEGLAEDHRDGARHAARAVAGKWVGLELVPEKVTSWDHSKLGGGY
jgi:PPOX class probable F420-dependent enzyme